MLSEFIRTHRQEILDRARSKIEQRTAPLATYTEITNGIPLFVDQLAESLRLAHQTTDVIVASATRHGGDLHRMGFTVTQVVHDYGDICQSVTELADEFHTAIAIDEFRILNKCLDDAIAGAVTEFARARELRKDDETALRMGELAHELRNKLGAATLAYTAIKAGAVGVGGGTGAVLDRNLRGMRELIDGALATARIESGEHHPQRISVRQLIEEVEADAALEARERGVTFSVNAVGEGLEVYADRTILAAAVINLLHNAFKFSHLAGHVSLTVTGEGERIFIAVQDECGGLPAGSHDDLFRPFTQQNPNRTGAGLGLSISRKGIEAHGGNLRVANLPHVGCIFTIDLPQTTPAVA